MSGMATAAEVTGKIMAAAIIILFLVVILVLFLHLYAKRFWRQSEEEEDRNNPVGEATRRRRFVFSPGQETALGKLGLDVSVLRSLQAVEFNPKEFTDGLDCAVCLAQLVEGDQARMLPKCNHGFHVDCIDMWFQSHSTCPLCRNPAGAESGKSDVMQPQSGAQMMSALEEGVGNVPAAVINVFTPNESRSYPTNVLFWGNELQVSSGAIDAEEGSNVAPISSLGPRLDERLVCDNSLTSSPSAMRFVEEEHKAPLLTRLRSLKRLLSRDRRVLPSSSSSNE